MDGGHTKRSVSIVHGVLVIMLYLCILMKTPFQIRHNS